MEQLADVYLELERHLIQLMGSLYQLLGFENLDLIQVGSFAQVPCFETPERSLGLFETLEAAYTAIIRQQMRKIASHEVNSLPGDNYLAFLWRFKTLPKLIAESVFREGLFTSNTMTTNTISRASSTGNLHRPRSGN